MMQKQKSVRGHRQSELPPTSVRYLELVRDTLTGTILRTPNVKPAKGEASAMEVVPFDPESRMKGDAWCEECFTMAGTARVQNVWQLVEETIIDKIPGDFLEAGVWRGGCSIMARIVQQVMEEFAKATWLCDSFSGLPPTSNNKDGDYWSKMQYLEVSEEEVKQNFERFQALDDNVHFRKGYFSETMPAIRKELQFQGGQLAVLRGDGDMYESYLDILYNLYEFIPVGGYFICDDCPGIEAAQQAIDDFRAHHGISTPVQYVEGSAFGSFWRIEYPVSVDYEWYLEWNATRTFTDTPSHLEWNATRTFKEKPSA